MYCNTEPGCVFFYFVWFAGTNGLVIYGGVTEDGFTINPDTGVISVTQVLDREFQDHYTITGNSSLAVCSLLFLDCVQIQPMSLLHQN